MAEPPKSKGDECYAFGKPHFLDTYRRRPCLPQSFSGDNRLRGVNPHFALSILTPRPPRPLPPDRERLAAHRSAKPWTSNPTYFHTASFSPSSSLKILSHCHSGVAKGLKANGKPVEVMGLLTGRPDPENEGVIIITDSFPLPIEGFETRVIADDQHVINHMIALGDLLEDLRPEKFCGWYHSHPFDLQQTPHTFFSSTDLSTQLQWQRSEDGHGNPWLGVVVDPIRSLSLKDLGEEQEHHQREK
ncbi:hypothetical protein TL16_g09147 [Triparma laevis f. inornata]|uniref:MPN domain-containing protein n=1 Tax=Triparma laevis f. inornata TaxID=1714386 RepID=A0A9W7B956_9STRA|nr:hypothetical protein TL16_g09147 [Triparma laevis f. inornata]